MNCMDEHRKWLKDHPIQAKWIDIKIKFEIWYHRTWIARKWYGDFYNSAPVDREPTKVEVPWQFRYYIWKMRKDGFNPLWFTLYLGEYTLIFEDKIEAYKAYDKYESNTFQAYWYGLNDSNNLEIDDKFLENCVEI
jgi:hypothetical protein